MIDTAKSQNRGAKQLSSQGISVGIISASDHSTALTTLQVVCHLKGMHGRARTTLPP